MRNKSFKTGGVPAYSAPLVTQGTRLTLMPYKMSPLSSPACTVPDCRRARCGKSLARTLDLVNSKPTTPGVDGEAAAEDAKVESVAAARRADRKVMVPKAMAQDMTVDYAGLLRAGQTKYTAFRA